MPTKKLKTEKEQQKAWDQECREKARECGFPELMDDYLSRAPMSIYEITLLRGAYLLILDNMRANGDKI